MATNIQGNSASATADEGSPVKIGGVYRSTQPTLTDGQRGDAQLDARGNTKVAIVGVDGTSGIASQTAAADALSIGGQQGLSVVSRNVEFNGATWDRLVKANLTARLLTAAASTNATSVKASAGNVHKVFGTNTNAAARYLKFYNKASSPTVGTDTPVLTFYLPPTAVGGGVFSFNLDKQYFSTGIAYALTTAAADADTGALTAGDVVAMNITYS